jgi:cystathionine beta-lyase/cystathionine gamma-synthase
MAAYTLHRGLQTLSVRVRAAQTNARVLARRLQEHPAVKRVLYPGIPGCDPRGVVGRQMSGPGSMIALDLKDGYEGASGLMANVRLITPAVSLGSCDTLIQHPAGLTHRIVDAAAREDGGIGPGLVRISVGIEDVEDLWEDLELALNVVSRPLAMSAK